MKSNFTVFDAETKNVILSTEKKSEYEKQAESFLRKNKIFITAKKYGYNQRNDGIEMGSMRGIDYKISISGNGCTWHFWFTDSAHSMQNDLIPSAYDILACLQKYDVEDDVFDFAAEYGYEITSRETFEKVEKIHEAVQDEFENVQLIFENCMDELQEIN